MRRSPARMRALHLLRHAKSSWDDPSLADVDRPLAPRGRRAATKIGAHLRRAGIAPALVLSSPSRRTLETLELLKLPDQRVLIEEALYAAGADELLAVLRTVPRSVPSVLLIGHNPGLQQLAVQLAGSGDERDLDRMRAKLPTGALASFELAVTDWKEPAAGTGTLVGYVVPKEL
jgi:phosphohistidine phosphatase